MTAIAEPTLLVVNADDYGYFPGVSRGILEAYRNGVVTATGVLANGTSFEQDAELLRSEQGLDVGVHLNLTYGSPLSAAMRQCLRPGRMAFGGTGWLVRHLLLRRIRMADVEAEWRAQVERCLDLDLSPSFVNSHQHVHMFPPLFGLIQSIAADYGIPYLRFADAPLTGAGRFEDRMRCAVLHGLAILNRRRLTMPAPRFLGAEFSGRLSREHMGTLLGGLEPGGVYELMCHPGHDDGADRAEGRVRAYHHWEDELACLTSEETRALCHRNNIRLVGYRDLGDLKLTE